MATLHVVPNADVVEHDDESPDPDCVCGPTVQPVEADDGSVGWLLIHHDLDGREHHEADGPPPGSAGWRLIEPLN